MWREVGRVFEHILKGKLIVPPELHAVGKQRGGFGQFVPPKCFARRSSHNNGDGLCLGQDAHDVIKKSDVVVGNRHHRVVFGQLVEVHPATLYQREEHRGCRKKVLPVRLHEIRGGRADSDDKVGLLIMVERTKVVDKCCV